MRLSQSARRAVFMVLSLLVFASLAEAYSSKAWQERIDARTTTLWIEGQDIGGIILNARGELNVIRLEQGLIRHLDKDTDVEEWVITNLGFYASNRKETRAKMKGRDVFVLKYRAVKYWNFDPTRLVINGYKVTSDDILTNKVYWESGELPPKTIGTLAMAIPSIKKQERKIEMRYDETLASFEVPTR